MGGSRGQGGGSRQGWPRTGTRGGGNHAWTWTWAGGQARDRPTHLTQEPFTGIKTAPVGTGGTSLPPGPVPTHLSGDAGWCGDRTGTKGGAATASSSWETMRPAHGPGPVGTLWGSGRVQGHPSPRTGAGWCWGGCLPQALVVTEVGGRRRGSHETAPAWAGAPRPWAGGVLCQAGTWPRRIGPRHLLGGALPGGKQAPGGVWSPRARWLPCRRAGQSGWLCGGVSLTSHLPGPRAGETGGDLNGGVHREA